MFPLALTATSAQTCRVMGSWMLVALVLAKCRLRMTGSRAFLFGLRQ